MAAGRGRPDGLSAVHTGGVRLTEFWAKMNSQFGSSYVDSFARDQVISGLGGVTVEAALARGDDAKIVWRAVCEERDVPAWER